MGWRQHGFGRLRPFVDDILHADLDRFFRNRQQRGNLSIGIPGGVEPQHIDFFGVNA